MKRLDSQESPFKQGMLFHKRGSGQNTQTTNTQARLNRHTSESMPVEELKNAQETNMNIDNSTIFGDFDSDDTPWQEEKEYK